MKTATRTRIKIALLAVGTAVLVLLPLLLR
jgi:hypothetical protein